MDEFELIQIPEFGTKANPDGNEYIPIADGSGTYKTTYKIIFDKLIQLLIVNNLVTDDGTKILSAKQGKLLRDLLNTKIDTASIVDDLYSYSPYTPLSSNQGRVLKELIESFSSQIGSGILGEAFPDTEPIEKGFGIYTVSQSGLYVNFKDSFGNPIEVTQGDIDSGLVQLWGNDGVWEKHITLIDIKPMAFTSTLIESHIIRSIGSDGKEVLSNIKDSYTGEDTVFKQVDFVPTVINGVTFISIFGNYYERSYKGSANIKWFGVTANGISDDTAAWNSISGATSYRLDSGISLITGSVVLPKGDYIFDRGSLIKISATATIRFSSGTNIYFEGGYIDNSESGTLLYEGGVISKGLFDADSDLSGRITHDGYAGNFIDKSSGSSVVFAGTNSYPHRLEANSQLVVIGGGYDNWVLENCIASLIAGGAHNRAGASHASIVGGAYQEIYGSYGFAGAGQYNKVHSSWSSVVGGQQNEVGDPDAVDTLVSRSAFIGGGTQNINKAIRSVIGGGLQNNIDKDSNECVIAGGTGNDIIASSNATIVGGLNGQVQGNFATIIGGSNCRASADYATASGTSQATGVFSSAIGDFNLAQKPRSVAQGGRSVAYLDGMRALANGQFSKTGDRQISEFTASRETNVATTIALGLFGGAQPIELRDNSTIAFSITVVARNTTTVNENAAWEFKGLIKRDVGAATTAIVGTVAKTLIASDAAASTWNADIVADTTNGALQVNVTGEVSKTIRWNSRIEFTELML